MIFQEFIPILQTAIAPAILINGVSIFTSTMNVRLGRIVDRTRILADTIRKGSDRKTLQVAQLHIFVKRARVVRMAIAFSSLCVLLAALMIITIFLLAVLRFEAILLLAALFICCMASLITSIFLFIRDTNHSLAALDLEIKLEL